MEPEIAPEKMRCVVVKPELVVPGCICVPEADAEPEAEAEVEAEALQIVEEGSIEETPSKIFVSAESGDEDKSLESGTGFEDVVGEYMSKSVLGEGSGEELYRETREEAGEDYTQMSDRTREEGQAFEDYMRFFIEEPCVPMLSSISSSEVSCVEPSLQRSIVIVKPEAMIYKDVILRAIFEAGFQIVGKRVIHLTPEQVSEIYAKHYGSPSFPHLVVTVSSGPVLVMSIAALNVIYKWKQMIGPDGSVREEWFFPISMRKRFGLQKSMPNSLHGSENIRESNRENRYFYSESILEPIITENAKITDFCNLNVNPVLLKGLTEVVKKKPLDPVLFLADWLLMNNPFQPRMPYNIAVTPT